MTIGGRYEKVNSDDECVGYWMSHDDDVLVKTANTLFMLLFIFFSANSFLKHVTMKVVCRLLISCINLELRLAKIVTIIF